MHVQLELGGSRRDLEIVIHHPDATVADLLDAVDPGGGAIGLRVDGRLVPARQRLDRAGIVPGATLCPAGDSAHGDRRSSPDAVVVARTVGGLDAGRAWHLPAGRHRIGRASSNGDPGSEPAIAIDHPTVSAAHADVVVQSDGSVAVVDLGSRNGTWIGDRPCGAASTDLTPDDLVRCGAVQLAITTAPLAGDRRPPSDLRRSGSRPFHRPPRPGPAPDPDPIEPPSAPESVGGATPLGVVSIVVPIVLGLVMVRVLHSWTYALFMLLSPALLIGTTIEQRRRGRRTRRRDAAAFRWALDELDAALATAQSEATRRTWQRLPGVAEAVDRAVHASPRLWERRPGSDDAYVVSAGLGPVRWAASVRGDRRSWPAAVRAAIDARGSLPDAPVEVSLADGQVVGVVGRRPTALAVGRALLLQAAALHGPADLAIVVAAGEHAAADWDWVKWLPHASASTTGSPPIASGSDAVGDLVTAVTEGRCDDAERVAASLPLLLVVVDGDDLLGGAGRARPLLRGGLGPVALLVVTDDAERLPLATTTIVDLDGDDGVAAVHHLDPPVSVHDVHAAGIAWATAERAARAMARFTDPEATPGADLPTTVTLPPLLGATRPSALSLRARWKAAGTDPPPTAVLGVAADGPVTVDLERDGPHALIAGTTGSGKSELLRTLVVSLAAASSPEHLSFVLIDFKGGSAFADCARLPHTVGFVTDLDEHLAARALRCLEAELRHRERLLAAAGAADLHDHRRRSGPDQPSLARLVVVIDEFATLAAELPGFVDALVGVAQRGRSLGVHLVLATQRPAGAVSANIQANTDLRIALRVQAPEDSQDVLGGPAAAAIPRSARGRAIVRFGPGHELTMQTALSSGQAARSRGMVGVRPFGIAALVPAGAGVVAGPTSVDGDGPTDLSELVDAAGEAFRATGLPPPHRPWPTPLPASVDLADLVERAAGEAAAPAVVPLGLADRPDEQRQDVFGWRPDAGGLLVVGVGGSGTTTAAETAVLSRAATTDPCALHVYVLDFGAGEHESLAALPHVGAVVGAGDSERQRRTLRLVAAELDRRRSDAGRRRDGPRVLLVVDGLAGFRGELEADADGWLDVLARIVADGPPVGISTIVTADRPGAVPPTIGGLVAQRVVLRLGDRTEHGAFGIPPSAVPDLPPGRGHLPDGPTLVQVAREPDLPAAVARIAARWTGGRPEGLPAAIGALPARSSRPLSGWSRPRAPTGSHGDCRSRWRTTTCCRHRSCSTTMPWWRGRLGRAGRARSGRSPTPPSPA